MIFWQRWSTNKSKFSFHNLVSSFFFCGYFWIMPGTFASLIVVFLSSLTFLINFHLPYLIPSFFLAFSLSLGVFAVNKSLKETSERDPGWIVIDEVAGQSIALLMVSQSFVYYLAAFAGFRFFDILKPFPIRNLEKIKGFIGVFLDDIAAGLFAGIVIRVIIIFL